ncbi:hypothetical protein [Phenylobacterium sp. SCN 70-31]|uniref:hypothetical protein n=1 Tax=Phenylobacterium sp. SCN 70-31 TaxID=1660129 RepID=UPI0025FCD0DE|nr:hypothetical protein [Phenylobacterium sp. SCN 70-31]
MEKARKFSDLDDSWANFLVATRLVFAKLGAGAKGDSTSEGWFARVLGEQRSDPLLSFVLYARNAEEHGIERSIEHAYDIRVVEGLRLEVDVTFEPNGDVTFRNTHDPSEVIYFALKGTPKAITDSRSGHTFTPPTEHLGSLMPDTSIFGIAHAAVAHLERLIGDAGRLPQRK